MLGKESPLYGRRTGQFKIEPLDYKETAVFHPNLSAEDNSLIYGITGGVPHYINKLDVRDSVDEALLDNFFDRSSYLYEEPGNLLKQELREPAIYNAIIKAIAEGASRMNDIKMKVGEENSVVSKYLKTLIDLGIAKKETPITEKLGKKTIYLLADNFFRFWYRFVPINMSAIDSDRIAKTYPHAVKQYLPDYMGLIYEKMCQDCCGTEYAFMDACYKDREVDWKMTSRGIWYFRDGKSVVISFSHPEARVKDAYLFYALTDAVKEIMRCEKFEEQL